MSNGLFVKRFWRFCLYILNKLSSEFFKKCQIRVLRTRFSLSFDFQQSGFIFNSFIVVGRRGASQWVRERADNRSGACERSELCKASKCASDSSEWASGRANGLTLYASITYSFNPQCKGWWGGGCIWRLATKLVSLLSIQGLGWTQNRADA